MPIFDYQCRACGHTFDALQKVGAEALSDCPECGQPELKKMLSAPQFHLKGGGWRNSEDARPKRPDIRPKMGHMIDSPAPHGDHSDLPDKPPAIDKRTGRILDERGRPGKHVSEVQHSHGKGHSHAKGGHTGSHGHDHKHDKPGHSHSHKHDQ